MEYTVTTNFHIWARGPQGPRALTLPSESFQQYTFTTNFHIWAQGPPRAPGPDSPPHNVLRLGSYQMGGGL